MSEQDQPQFPNYEPPKVQLVDPKHQKPLNKMLKFLAKPPRLRDPFHMRRPKPRKIKTVRYY
jgi:hypothetical protein